MSKKSPSKAVPSKAVQSATVKRKRSDAGKVFPCGVRVDKTPYGLGVFAFAFIPEGTPIARVSGNIIHDPDYSSDYCIDAGDDKVLEPEPPFCYLNHSCEPNCMLSHYVREADCDESEDLETGELSEDEMALECDCGCHCDDSGIYGGMEEGEEIGSVEEEDESDADDPSFEDDTDAEIWVESIKDIMPNEQLTIDYAWTADRAMKCLCGSAQCRGWIVDPSERELLPP